MSTKESWFGKLDLAYKYSIVFGGLIALTMLAGACKVFYNHRRLKKFTAEAENVEAGKKEDQVELNQREKDEGDLFGIRAIEAGFFGGVHQSRPTSRAGSFVDSGASRGTSTLLGGVSSALGKDNYASMNSSVTTLPVAHTAGDRDSSNSPPRRKSPPTIKLAPSEAELSGRINHNVAVNMNLNVPPSPVMGRHPQSPTFGGSDDGSDGRASPASLSPHSPTFPSHYAPRAPQIPMPSGLSVTVHAPEEPSRSQAASFNSSAPSSRGPSPQTALPSIPSKALRDDPPLTTTAPKRPSSPPHLLPPTYQPTHQRDMSDASSVYDMNRASMQQSITTSSTEESGYDFSFPEPRGGAASNAGSLSSSNTQNNRQSTFLSAGNGTSDPRLSEFYDAYYRQSQLINPTASATESTQRRPGQLNLVQDTIVEVESPLPSPNPSSRLMGPGAAL